MAESTGQQLLAFASRSMRSPGSASGQVGVDVGQDEHVALKFRRRQHRFGRRDSNPRTSSTAVVPQSRCQCEMSNYEGTATRRAATQTKKPNCCTKGEMVNRSRDCWDAWKNHR
jgi:hypothetical protein